MNDSDQKNDIPQTVPNVGEPKPKIFLSYGRKDAKDLADRLCVDLAARGYDVWQDTSRIRAGWEWEQEIKDDSYNTTVVISRLARRSLSTEATAYRITGQFLQFKREAFAFKVNVPLFLKLAWSCSHEEYEPEDVGEPQYQ